MGNHLRTLFLVLCCYTYVEAQVGPPPGLNVQEAPLIDCYLPGYAQSTYNFPNTQDYPDAFNCGSIENNQWMAFTAFSGTYIFTIEVGNCQNTGGLQAMVFGINGICPPSSSGFVPISTCISPNMPTTMQVTATGMNFNEVYYLMIDGWSGDVCDYEIIDVQKLAPYDPDEPYISGPTTVSAGQAATYTVLFPPASPHINPCLNVQDTACGGICISNINDYTMNWSGPPGAMVLPIPGTYSAEIFFGNQGGLVTVELEGLCFNLTLELEVTVQLQQFQAHCGSDGPFNYCGQSLFLSGLYACDLDPYTVEFLYLEVFPFFQQFIGVEICTDECYIVAGTEVCGDGTHIIPFVDGFGCHAEYVVELEEVVAEAYLPAADTLSPSNPSLTLPGFNPNNSPEVVYEWTGPGITPDIANEPNPEISLPGWYHLEVYHPTLGCYSSDLIIIYYDSNCIPNTPVAPSDSCWSAPSFCSSYLDGFCSSTSGYSADTSGNLNTVLNCSIENNQWLRFIPCENQVELEFFVYNCAQNQGLEFFVLQSSDCAGFAAAAQCFQVANGSTSNFVVNGLSPGATYYLMIDGVAGDWCEYNIQVIDGIDNSGDLFLEFDTFTEGYIDGPASVCLNQPATYTLVPGDCSLSNFNSLGNCPLQYQTLCDSIQGDTINWNFSMHMDTLWHLPAGAAFLGDSTTGTVAVVFTDTLGGTIWVELTDPMTGYADTVFLEGTCTAFCGAINFTNNCTDTWSMEVSVEYTVDTLETVFLCEGACLTFCEETICSPGYYACPDTCRFQLLPVELIEDEFIDLGQVSLCEDSCYQFQGQFFCGAGSFSVIDSSSCTVTYTFEIIETPNDTIELGIIELCEGDCYEWADIPYCDSGEYLIESVSDCPVFHHFEIIYQDSDTTQLGIIELCPDSCFQLLDLSFCDAGFYTVADTTSNCTQWYSFAIQLLPPAVVDLGVIELCPDSCFVFAGTVYCSEGSYEIVLPGTCPTLHSFELAALSVDTVSLGIQPICEGECFNYQGTDYCTPGIYHVADQQSGSCPTITSFEVMVDSSTVVPLGLFELCQGDCFLLNGESFCESGSFEVQAIDPDGCYVLYTFSLETINGSNLTIGPVIELCDPTYTQYTISFNINSEFPPYAVNGQEISGNTFTSNPIPSGAPYTFEVSDGNACSANEWIQGQYSCPLVCVTDGGEMDTTTLFPCLEESFSAEHFGNAQLGYGDTLEYILHTNAGSTIGTILDRNFTGSFNFMPGSMEYEIPYYVSAVAGPFLNGMVDLTDTCSSVAAGQPVIFFEPVALQIQAPTILTCLTSSSTLVGAITGGSGQFDMQWAHEGVPVGQESTVSVEVPGYYHWVVVDLLTGCTVFDTTLVEADQEIPEFQLVNSGFDCGQPAALSIPDPAPDWSIAWTLPNGTVESGPEILTAEGGTVEVVVTAGNGCTKFKSIQLPEPPEPIESIALEVQQPQCPGIADGFIAVRAVEGGTTPYHYQLNGLAPIFNLQFIELEPGDYLLEVYDANGCTWEEHLTLEAPVAQSIDLGPDRTIFLGETLTLQWEAAGFEPQSVQWFENGQWISSETEFLTVAPQSDTEYLIRCRTAGGCLLEDRITVFVKDVGPVYIPNVFSPNGDGINDHFYVHAGPNVERVQSIQIYSRWGEQVFSAFDVPPNDKTWGWDGNYRQKPMNSAVFVYLIEVALKDGSIQQFRGDVLLRR